MKIELSWIWLDTCIEPRPNLVAILRQTFPFQSMKPGILAETCGKKNKEVFEANLMDFESLQRLSKVKSMWGQK